MSLPIDSSIQAHPTVIHPQLNDEPHGGRWWEEKRKEPLDSLEMAYVMLEVDTILKAPVQFDIGPLMRQTKSSGTVVSETLNNQAIKSCQNNKE